MRIAFHGYDGKGDRIASVLADAGHEIVADNGDIALVDHDGRHLCHGHERVVVYPHGGNPILEWDGHLPVHPNVRLQLTHSDGHSAVLEAYDYPKPVDTIGWCYSDLAEPRYPEPRRVLFAPAHATGHGYISAASVDLNQRILHTLRASGLLVTVRLYGPPDRHGLTHVDDVTWTQGGTLAHEDIDAADVVIADGTVAHLAAARGAPLIMFGSDVYPDLANGGPDDKPVHPARWSEYRHLMRYPHDFDDGPLDKLVDAATRPAPEVDEWRARWVQPFDPAKVATLIEAVCNA